MVTRGEPRERAILQAAIELVGETGYDALTVDAVAARAGASKATIYRRWRNKQQLVRAALDMLDARASAGVPDSGVLRTDLIGALQQLRSSATPAYLALVSGLATAMRFDPELKLALEPHLRNDELSPLAVCLERARGRGEIDAEADTGIVHDAAEAMILRQFALDRPLDDAFISATVDRLLIPLLVCTHSEADRRRQ